MIFRCSVELKAIESCTCGNAVLNSKLPDYWTLLLPPEININLQIYACIRDAPLVSACDVKYANVSMYV